MQKLWMILAILINKRPKIPKSTSILVANNGNMISTIPNAIATAPRPILISRDDLGMPDDNPMDILSILTTNNVI